MPAPAMMVLVVVLLAYLAFFLFTCRAPYSGDEWGPQWLSCGGMVKAPSRQRHSSTAPASLGGRARLLASHSEERLSRSGTRAKVDVPAVDHRPIQVRPREGNAHHAQALRPVEQGGL